MSRGMSISRAMSRAGARDSVTGRAMVRIRV